MKTRAGTLIGFSTRPGSVSLDGTGRNSHYAAALLAHMEVPGKDLSAVLVSVRNDVLKATAGSQVPWEHTSLTERVFLRPEPRLDAGQGKDYEKQREIAYWNSVRNTKSVAALEAYLERYPAGTFAGLARAMIVDLAPRPDTPTQATVTIASNEPTVGQKPQSALGVGDPRTLAQALRKELERVGCLVGAPDDPWDDRTRKALGEFSRHAKVSVPVDAPTPAALKLSRLARSACARSNAARGKRRKVARA